VVALLAVAFFVASFFKRKEKKRGQSFGFFFLLAKLLSHLKKRVKCTMGP
jgi:hypothetical protein